MVFALVRSHCDVNFFLQLKHSPQAMGNDATTRSPALKFFTPGPALSTTPQNSWPRTSPFCIWGMTPVSDQHRISHAQGNSYIPWYKWRSLPQIVLPVILTITSSWSMTLGLGISTASVNIWTPKITSSPTYRLARSFFQSISSPWFFHLSLARLHS